MKAPSERHLEDWIVANPHKFKNCADEYGWTDFERYLAQAEGELLTHGKPYFNINLVRQVELSCGYADLVGLRGNKIGVVELKKNAVNEKTLVQLMKYINEIEHMILFRELEVVPNFWSREHKRIPSVFGFAVGYGQPSKQTIEGCPSRISLVSYDFDGCNYSFTASDTHIEYSWNQHRQPLSINERLLPLIDTSILSVYEDDVA